MARDHTPHALASIALVALLACASRAHADSVRCHIVYGGEDFTIDATPTTQPYRAESVKIGRYFEFKLVYATLPVTGDSIRVYVYGVSTGTPVLIHQGGYVPPFDARGDGAGFTGYHSVYEPSKSSEIQYWCQYYAGDLPARQAPVPTEQLTPVPPRPQ